MKKSKKLIYYTCVFFSGLINSLLGTGGGILLITILAKLGIEPKKAHATSICIILPICIFSACIYMHKQCVCIADASEYIVGGILGAIIGSFVLSKINPKILKKFFGFFIILAAIQLIVK